MKSNNHFIHLGKVIVCLIFFLGTYLYINTDSIFPFRGELLLIVIIATFLSAFALIIEKSSEIRFPVVIITGSVIFFTVRDMLSHEGIKLYLRPALTVFFFFYTLKSLAGWVSSVRKKTND